jgi:glycosyltransferase involved in cell wall biosynthesis
VSYCKKKVLFVGSFKKTSKDGSVGGQMFASNTIVNSDLSDHIEWTLIDTTSDKNILSSNFVRLKKAILRVFKYTYNIVFFKYDYLLIFVSDGYSFWEKGLMGILGKALTNSKVIMAPRSGFIINDLNYNPRLKSFITYVIKKVDLIICQSNSWKDLFQQISRENDAKFTIIENLIDFEKYNIIPIECKEKNEKITILFMAWVTRNKGIYELIESVTLLKKDNIDFKLIIAGDGIDYDIVLEEVKNRQLSEYIDFQGWVLNQDKLDLLSKSDVFVLPTYFDGYPNSLMEAMAAGKACIATKVGSIPDMIVNNETGILIDKQNPLQLYESLKFLIQNEDIRKNMGIAAQNSINKVNSLPVGIAKYKKIFNIV